MMWSDDYDSPCGPDTPIINVGAGEKRANLDFGMDSTQNLNRAKKKLHFGESPETLKTHILSSDSLSGDTESNSKSEFIATPENTFLTLTDSELVNIDQSWKPYSNDDTNDLEINTELFRKGILMVRAVLDDFSAAKNEGLNLFRLGSRTLTFNNIDSRNKLRKVPNITEKLLHELQAFSGSGVMPSIGYEDRVIFNQDRHEEIFLPLSIKSPTNAKPFGFYVYPWLSPSLNKISKNEFKFLGFKQFVTAGCIFGTSLQGLDQYNAIVNLIKHDCQFHTSQKIISIKFNSKSYGAYETMLFSELNKFALLINSLSDKSSSAQLYYHLPAYDYILFGIELFIKGRITIPALDKFLEAVQIRKEQFVSKVTEIFKKHNIIVIMGSPFEDLFNKLFLANTNKSIKFDAKYILQKLGISHNEREPLEPESQIQQEKLFVRNCISQLTNPQCSAHHQIWYDLANKVSIEGVDNLEQLFKIANAVSLAIAAKGRNDYETCSLLPVSEKQIQVEYASFNKKPFKADCYPAIFNLTTLDPVISYDHTADNNTKGLLFYFRDCQKSFRKLIDKKQALNAIHENVVNEDAVDLETVLSEKKNFYHGN